jgi:hypothetical protein
MLIKIDASNEDNFKAKKLIVPGTYVFCIAKVTPKSSKAGNSMIVLEMKCQDDGEFRGATLFDNVVLTQNSEWKFIHLCLSAGFSKDEIKNGIEIEDIKDRYVKVKVGIQPKQGQYAEKNIVEAFVFDEA